MGHQHTLKWNGSKAPSFMCSDCKEPGFESSYICTTRNCSYILHKECQQPVKHAVHPFLKNCNFEFTERASNGGFCDACGKDLLGFFYWCRKTTYALHPCCLNLKDKILKHDGTVRMTLSHKVPSNCVRCKQRHVVRNQFEGWSYVVNSDEKSCIHVSCFKDMILENWNTNGDTDNNRSKGKERFILFSKLMFGVLNVLFTWDPTAIADIVEAIIESFSEH
ncbi:hypothetical protein TSUD_123690 [Trifolium subterraneum]|uniref:DC1 domain-containing protein n=1 Tax=Trifolium subterraneum TaxID=3900 RepID=A0A2Z6P4S9_TRISU|nr:hypothetical protein TSUD_123690 [Trifolium subterraneum]